MKPALVDYDKIFKKKGVLTEKISVGTNIQQISNTHFFFNFFAIILIIVGIVLLYYRKKRKLKNKRLQTQKIIQFYHDTNKFD